MQKLSDLAQSLVHAKVSCPIGHHQNLRDMTVNYAACGRNVHLTSNC